MARLKWLIIPIFLIFVMSHNAGAISTNLVFDDIIVKGSSLTPTVSCNINNAAALISYSWCYTNNDTVLVNTLNDIHTTDSFTVDSGDYIEFDLVVRTDTEYDVVGSYYLEDVNIYTPSGMRLVSRDMVINSTFYDNTVIDGTTTNDGNYYYHVYRYVYRYVGNETTSVQLGLRQQSAARGFVKFVGPGVRFRLANVVVYQGISSSESAQDREENATQEQSENAESAADTSSDDVSSATQNLASAMGSIVSTIKDTPASDCNISISTTGSSAGFTSAIGALNLCSGVPSNILNTIRGLAALVIVPYVLYAAYSITVKMYRTFTEVQNT